jgi:ribose 5-phosphate isomerase RpiB
MTSPIVAKEILEAWFNSSPEEEEKANIEKVKQIEKKYNR